MRSRSRAELRNEAQYFNSAHDAMTDSMRASKQRQALSYLKQYREVCLERYSRRELH